MANQRTLIESLEFSKLLAEIGDIKRLDEVLCGLCWSLSKNPEGWSVVTGFKTIRLAKTDGYGNTPVLSLWFRIISDNEVLLLAIEQDELDSNDD